MEQLKMQLIWLAVAFSNYYTKQYQRTKQNSKSKFSFTYVQQVHNCTSILEQPRALVQ